LFPPSIEKMIPRDHVGYLVESFVDSLDFNSFDIKYAGAGHPAYHPRIIMKLLVMGVIDKVRSSRRLARNARENVVYIYLSEKLSPDFRTVSDFRKNNPELIKEAFKHTVIIAKKEGMLDLSVLSTDGSKLKANASNRSVLSSEELLFLSNFIDTELDEWAKQDNLEDGFFGEVRGSDQLPEKSKKKMKQAVENYIKQVNNGEGLNLPTKIQKAKEELQRNDIERVSVTDPESRFMKSKKSKIEFSYNPQLTVDKKGFIIANDLVKDVTDVHQLQSQVTQTEENLGEIPENTKWNFDNGYYESNNLVFLNKKNIDAYILPQEKKNKDAFDSSLFVYDKNNDEYVCPEGKRLGFLNEQFYKDRGKKFRMYKVLSGEECRCTKSKKRGRHIKRFLDEKIKKDMEEKMKTDKAKEIYKNRRQTVEPVFGDLKENKGFTSFLTRSLSTTSSEFNLACTAMNLVKMQNLGFQFHPPP
jgi:transposase